MNGTCEVAEGGDRRAITEFLEAEGSRSSSSWSGADVAIDEVIEVRGRATIEAMLERGLEG